MSLRKVLQCLAMTACLGFLPLPARAGIPVIDGAAVANLIQQIMYWQQQITAMSNQLNQLRQSYGAITGGRGMEGLVPMSNPQRNYLPQDYAELMRVVDGTSSAYAGLSAQVKAAMDANSVLSTTQLGTMTTEMRQIVENGRRSAAMVSTLTQTAYQNTSQRFAALQSLINAIATAGDEKAILDLQGRVNTEQTMLTNEQTKLQMLYQIAQGQKWAEQQRIREKSTSDIGSINSLPSVAY
jgi:type IV secretion system protein VirB5